MVSTLSALFCRAHTSRAHRQSCIDFGNSILLPQAESARLVSISSMISQTSARSELSVQSLPMDQSHCGDMLILLNMIARVLERYPISRLAPSVETRDKHTFCQGTPMVQSSEARSTKICFTAGESSYRRGSRFMTTFLAETTDRCQDQSPKLAPPIHLSCWRKLGFRKCSHSSGGR